jgi:hypothetical protein
MLIIQFEHDSEMMLKKPACLQGFKKTTPTRQINQESQLPG